ncbi:MAG: hypothetical protein IIB57_13630 [Planctomycetes bacterium]|nr:hypothetical protein [Planctomycetota bacterium]
MKAVLRSVQHWSARRAFSSAVVTYLGRTTTPAELLGTNWFGELLGRLRDVSDIVLIDSPPLLSVTDAMVVAGQVDGVLLVTRSGVTRLMQRVRSI